VPNAAPASIRKSTALAGSGRDHACEDEEPSRAHGGSPEKRHGEPVGVGQHLVATARAGKSASRSRSASASVAEVG